MLTEEEALNAMKEAQLFGVKEAMSCSTSFLSNQKNLSLSKKNIGIKAAIGLYPIDALELNEEELNRSFDFFSENIKDASAVGEVGLDFKLSKNEEEREKQKIIFERFLSLAQKNKKPIIIHSRYAQTPVLEILSTFNLKKVILHSFIDSEKLMKIASDKGYYVSAGCSVLYNSEIEKRIAPFSLNSLLFETDSPIRFNGEMSMPKKIVQIAQKTAEIKKMALSEVESTVERNYHFLFG
jgi:TatD DNase family protein